MLRLFTFVCLVITAGCRFGTGGNLFPELEISESDTYDFGELGLNSETTKLFTVTNVGDTDASDLSASLSGNDFQFLGGTYPGTNGTCGTTLAMRDSCSVVVRFAPISASANLTGSLTFSYYPNQSLGAKSVTRLLSGRSLSAATLSISDGSTYDYGRVVINTNSDKTFTITNTGGSTAVNLSLTTVASPYSLPGGGSCGSILASGESCTLIVRYTPTAFSQSTATVTLNYNNGLIATNSTRDLTGLGVGRSGTLDTTFATRGILGSRIGLSQEIAYGSYLQTDGKIVRSGTFTDKNVTRYFVSRTSSDGRIDTSFNTVGYMTHTDLNYRKIIQSPSGNYFTVGESQYYAGRSNPVLNSNAYPSVLKILSDGRIDTTFGTEGFSYYGLTGTDWVASGVAVQSDEKIFLSSYAPDPSLIIDKSQTAVARLLTNGSLDTSFSTTGKVIIIADVGIPINWLFSKAIAVYDYGAGERLLHLTIQSTGGATIDAVTYRYLTDGRLDTTFNTDGEHYSSVVAVTNSNSFIDMVVNSSGKIWVGTEKYSAGNNIKIERLDTGGFSEGNASDLQTGIMTATGLAPTVNGGVVFAGVAANQQRALFRMSDTFGMDTSFNTTGILITSFNPPNSNDSGNLQYAHTYADGRVLLSGTSIVGPGFDLTSLRVSSSGTYDTTFMTTGKSANNLINITRGAVRSLSYDTSGRLLVANQVYTGNYYSLALLRYNTDFSIDTSFNTSGLQYSSIGVVASIGNQIRYVTTFSNGNIFVMGDGLRMQMFKSDGQLDTSFSTTGNFLAVGGNWSGVSALQQTDGKFVIASGTSRFTYRFFSDGTLDTAFDVTSFGTSRTANSLVLLTDGKVVAAGTATLAGIAAFGIAKYGTQGDLDTSFSTDGFSIDSITGSNQSILNLYQQTNGIFVGAGWFGSKFAWIRYQSDGSLDTQYATSGTAIQSFSINVTVSSSVLQTDGKIFSSGTKNAAGGTHWMGVRIKTDGGLDTTFATSGFLTISLPTTSANNASILQTDGKIILGGWTSPEGIQVNPTLMRLWP